MPSRFPAWSAARRVQAREPSAVLHELQHSWEVRVGRRVLGEGRTPAGAWNAALDALGAADGSAPAC